MVLLVLLPLRVCWQSKLAHPIKTSIAFAGTNWGIDVEQFLYKTYNGIA